MFKEHTPLLEFKRGYRIFGVFFCFVVLLVSVIIIKKLSTRRRGTEEANSLFEVISSNIYEAQKTSVVNSNPEKRPRRIMRFLRRSIAAPEFK